MSRQNDRTRAPAAAPRERARSRTVSSPLNTGIAAPPHDPLASPFQRPTPRTSGPPASPRITPLPKRLRAGLERMSGFDLSRVQVHRNSAEPDKVGAHALARGNEIHLAAGQERHLPHEGWHLIQQRQRRVATSGYAGGMAVSTDRALEREADDMGRRATSGEDAFAAAAGAEGLLDPSVPAGGPAQLKSKFAPPLEQKPRETPVATLHREFADYFADAGVPETYNFQGFGGPMSPANTVFQQPFSRAEEVGADIDPQSRGSADPNTNAINLYGGIGMMERTLFGESDRGVVYVGGLLVPHALMDGNDADVQGNIAPRDGDRDQIFASGWEMIPEDMQQSAHFRYEVQLAYDAETYDRTGKQIRDAGVFNPLLELMLPEERLAELDAKRVAFVRWVPFEWISTITNPDAPISSAPTELRVRTESIITRITQPVPGGPTGRSSSLSLGSAPLPVNQLSDELSAKLMALALSSPAQQEAWSRKRMVARLKSNPGLLEKFIAELKEINFAPQREKIYVAITAMQRGDFHKFKWSIRSDPHLVAVLPIGKYPGAWIKDLLGRAEALELVARGRWIFIHSGKLVSKRARSDTLEEGETSTVGFDSQTFKAKKLADAAPGEETIADFEGWAREQPEEGKIYNIDAIVPLYNSELVRINRGEFLDAPSPEAVDLEAAGAVVAALAGQFRSRNVVVLWGSRTAPGREYLQADISAREFRHKTGKSMMRLLSAAAHSTGKLCVLAGDPLSNIECDVDLTEMWDAAKMHSLFGINRALGRIEQEFVFYQLAKLAESTLHVGMQSGNIETLINNPRTNVIVVNENTKGGAGLKNVERISEEREVRVGRRKADPFNLYLSYNLDVLPTVIGELTRTLMTKEYGGEGVTMGQGMRKLVAKRLGANEKDFSGASITELLALAASTAPRTVSGARPNMLAESGEELLEHLLVYLAGKVGTASSSSTHQRAKQPVRPGELRPEIRLLELLVMSGRPRVHLTIRALNNVLAKKVRTPEEIGLDYVVDTILKNETFRARRKAGQGALPPTLRASATVLVEQFGEVMGRENAEYQAFAEILTNPRRERLIKLVTSNRVKAELQRDPHAALRKKWNALSRALGIDLEDMRELAPVLAFLGLE